MREGAGQGGVDPRGEGGGRAEEWLLPLLAPWKGGGEGEGGVCAPPELHGAEWGVLQLGLHGAFLGRG